MASPAPPAAPPPSPALAALAAADCHGTTAAAAEAAAVGPGASLAVQRQDEQEVLAKGEGCAGLEYGLEEEDGQQSSQEDDRWVMCTPHHMAI